MGIESDPVNWEMRYTTHEGIKRPIHSGVSPIYDRHYSPIARIVS